MEDIGYLLFHSTLSSLSGLLVKLARGGWLVGFTGSESKALRPRPTAVCSVRPCLRKKCSVTTQHFASITQFADTSWTEYKIKLFPFTLHTSLSISWKTKWFYETIVILHHLFSPAAKANLRVLALLGDILNIFRSSFCSSITPSLALWSRVVSLFFSFPPLCLACKWNMSTMSPLCGIEPFLTSNFNPFQEFLLFRFSRTFSQGTSLQPFILLNAPQPELPFICVQN